MTGLQGSLRLSWSPGSCSHSPSVPRDNVVIGILCDVGWLQATYKVTLGVYPSGVHCSQREFCTSKAMGAG